MPRVLGHLWAGKSPLRRSLSAALLAAYIVTAVGVPLPLGARPPSDELYPCMNCACGCASAEQCWRSCCCHTLAERFAWAREHRVRPPEYAIAQAQLSGLDLAWLGIFKASSPSAPSRATCCNHSLTTAVPACCQKKTASCCDHARSSCSAHDHEHESSKESTSGDHIVAWRALACHGQSMNWLAAVPTLVVSRPELSGDAPRVTWLGPAISETAEALPTEVVVPPA